MRYAIFALLPVLALAGCVRKTNLDRLQDLCAEQGGMLMIIYTQEITAKGPGEQIPNPGRCVMPENFEKSPAPPPPAPPAKP